MWNSIFAPGSSPRCAGKVRAGLGEVGPFQIYFWRAFVPFPLRLKCFRLRFPAGALLSSFRHSTFKKRWIREKIEGQEIGKMFVAFLASKGSVWADAVWFLRPGKKSGNGGPKGIRKKIPRRRMLRRAFRRQFPKGSRVAEHQGDEVAIVFGGHKATGLRNESAGKFGDKGVVERGVFEVGRGGLFFSKGFSERRIFSRVHGEGLLFLALFQD
ncbi:hypothetical protein TRVL_01812 [Trypanosoma vivax]|nr:hypothetical protein TRVL_01812 [Trypanosoma vivax]